MIGLRNKTIFGSIFMQKNQQKTLIIGAAASGKSQYAEDILNNKRKISTEFYKELVKTPRDISFLKNII